MLICRGKDRNYFSILQIQDFDEMGIFVFHMKMQSFLQSFSCRSNGKNIVTLQPNSPI